MKLCWLVPGDRSGGISPVALSCCRQAVQAGHDVTLLLLVSPTWLTSSEFRVDSLHLYGCAAETPKALLHWLAQHPQDVLFFNACGEFDPAIPYLPPQTRSVFVVHDTAPPYWCNALSEEPDLDAIVAVSQTVAVKFRHRLQQPDKLSVIYNGCVFPDPPATTSRRDDLIFLGGDNPTKGAFDVLKVWTHLIKLGFSGDLHWFGNIAPAFKAKIEQLPNSDRIHLYGYVQRELIFSIAATAKVLLMLSRVEPFGMATIEAMSMGCVPVAWDVETGTKEITTANQTGLFAALGDPQALAQQVLKACRHHSTFKEAVMEQARSHFNETVMWQGYAALIDQIVALPPLTRRKTGQEPPLFQPPVRRFQLLPPGVRAAIREFVGRSPGLGYWLRDMRGW